MMSNQKTPSIKFPPLKDADGKPEPVLSVRFAVGRFTIEITTDGAGGSVSILIPMFASLS